jgi:formylmethanofuran dehydrogenase subunit B
VPQHAIACPFCGLVCDDLVLEGERVETHGCAKGAAGFARRPLHLEHRVGGRAAPLDEAVAAAAKLLAAARLPLVSGLAADLAGIRALIALADRLGAVIDRWQSAAQQVNLGLLQQTGGLTTTFGEIANRADVALLIGGDPGRRQPRFFERLLRNRTALYRSAPPFVAFIGPGDAAPADAAVGERVTVAPEALLDAVSALAASATGGRLAPATALPLSALSALGERLAAARYGVVVWDIAAFPAAARSPALAILLRLLRHLTRRTRCAGLALGGEDNAQGAAQAMLWQAGWPGRLSFATGVPQHDPWSNDAERLVAAGEVDALLWAASLSAAPLPKAGVPTVALIAADAPETAAEVEIRVGIPGIDHGGTMLRADTVVALPVAATRPSGLPSVASVAQAILAHLPEAS